MDLNVKAQWHLDFNGGMVPVLETPEGELIKESSVVAMYAHEAGKDNGIDLFPKDPI
jgi:glutathione S-transferase